MADKVASIKVGLKAEGFRKGLKDAEGDASASGKKMGDGLKRGLSAGAKGALDSIKGGLSNLKTFIGGLGLFAGLPGIKDQIGNAIKLETKYRNLAFAIKVGTGASVAWKDIQAGVQSAAMETGNSTEDLADAYQELFRKSGDAEFAAGSMKSVGVAATASGESVADLAKIAGELERQFGVGAESMDDALASVLALGNQGGVGVQELASKLGEVGSVANAAGFKGVEGFGQIANMLKVATVATGSFEKSLGATTALIDTLSNDTAQKGVLLKFGVKAGDVDGSAMGALEGILKKTGGDKAKLSAAFGGDQLKIVAELGQTYAKTFAQTEGDVKTKTAAAVAAYRAAIDDAGDATLTGAELRAKAAAEMQSSEKKFQVAMNKVEQAFSKPEITDAITKLMEHLPALADMVAKVVSFSVEHPVAAGAAAIGGLGVKGAITTGASSLGSTIMSSLTKGGGSAATSIGASLSSGATGLVSKLATSMGPAGAALAAAAGIGLAAYMGKQLYDQLDDNSGSQIWSKFKNDIGYTSDAEYEAETLERQGVKTGADYDALQMQKAIEAKYGSDAFKTPPPPGVGINGGAPPPAGTGTTTIVEKGPAAPSSTNIASAIAGQELKVRLVNPRDIAIASPGARPLPLPGYVPR